MSIKTKILMLKGEKGDPGGATWGNISGTLSSQTDLNTALQGKADTTDLGAVCFTNDYADLSNKPQFSAVAESGDYEDLTNTPNLATVATSGSYTDLSNKPTQLTDFSGVLPLTQGGTGADTAGGARTNLNVYKEYVLFDNETGTHQNITLSDSVLNYVKIGIYFMRYHTLNPPQPTKPNLRGYQEVCIYAQNDIPVSLSILSNDEENFFNECTCLLTVSGNTLTFSKNDSFTFAKEDSTFEVSNARMSTGRNIIKIYRVVGFKY